MRTSRRRGFTFPELLVTMIIISVIGYALVLFVESMFGMRGDREDTVASYDALEDAFGVLNPLIANIGIGMPTNVQSVGGDGTAVYKPHDEFALSWLGPLLRNSAPFVCLGTPQKKFGTIDPATSKYVGYGPLKLTRPVNLWDSYGALVGSLPVRADHASPTAGPDDGGTVPNNTDLWFAYGVPTGVTVRGVSRNRKINRIPDDRVPLSTAYISAEALRDPKKSNWGTERDARFANLRGYWNDGSDSTVLLVGREGVETLKKGYGMVTAGINPDSGEPNAKYKPEVTERFSFMLNKLSVLQEVHPILQSTKFTDLRMWLLLPSYRVPLAVENIWNDKLTVKPAPGAAYCFQVVEGRTPQSAFDRAPGLLMGGPLTGMEELYVPRLGHVFLDRRVGELILEVYADFPAGAGAPRPEERRVLAQNIAALRFFYDPNAMMLTMTVAAKGRKEPQGASDVQPLVWPERKAGEEAAFSEDDLRHRIFVRSMTWRLDNIF